MFVVSWKPTWHELVQQCRNWTRGKFSIMEIGYTRCHLLSVGLCFSYIGHFRTGSDRCVSLNQSTKIKARFLVSLYLCVKITLTIAYESPPSSWIVTTFS